jgi:hypothetical protein
MTRFGFIVRTLMLAACVVPFTSTRQAGALLALAPTAPIQTAPAPQEDDSERSEQVGKVRLTRLRLDHRLGARGFVQLLPPVHRPQSRIKTMARSLPVDHFNNGLGSPYLC